jgi:hypothetical protein
LRPCVARETLLGEPLTLDDPEATLLHPLAACRDSRFCQAELEEGIGVLEEGFCTLSDRHFRSPDELVDLSMTLLTEGQQVHIRLAAEGVVTQVMEMHLLGGYTRATSPAEGHVVAHLPDTPPI